MANFYAIPGGVGLRNGSSWANAYNEAGLRSQLVGALPDDYHFLKGTPFGLESIISGRDGTDLLPIHIIGCRAVTINEPPVFSDWAYAADRPLLAMGVRNLAFDNYWKIRNLEITSDAFDGLKTDDGSLVQNLKITHTGFLHALSLTGSRGTAIDCELISTGIAVGFAFGGVGLNLYIHDSNRGVEARGDDFLMENCILDTLTGAYGLDLTNTVGNSIFNSIFYNISLGINAVGVARSRFINNIFHTCVNPAGSESLRKSNHWDFNVWYANTNAPTLIEVGPNALYVDPQFVDAPGGDFRIGRNIWGKGFGIGLGVATPSISNPGAWQGEPPVDYPAGVLDLSEDIKMREPLEAVTLDGTVVNYCYRLPLTEIEAAPSYGSYIQGDAIFHLPTLTSILPVIGSVIVAGGASYKIQTVLHPVLNNYWEVLCRESRITSDTELQDLISLWPVVVTIDDFGSSVRTHPAADADFTDVPARIAIRPAEKQIVAGKEQFIRRFDVFVARDVPIHVNDLIRDNTGMQYDVVSWENREDIAGLSRILVEYTD